jgi:hypothetical protein
MSYLEITHERSGARPVGGSLGGPTVTHGARSRERAIEAVVRELERRSAHDAPTEPQRMRRGTLPTD